MDILKQYHYLEQEDAKFVQETYFTDQIGVRYMLYGISDFLEIVEYQEEGITKNIDKYKLKNAKVMVLHYGLLLSKVSSGVPNKGTDIFKNIYLNEIPGV